MPADEVPGRTRMRRPGEAGRVRTAVVALTIATLLTAALNAALAPGKRPVEFELAPDAGALRGLEAIESQTYADFVFIGAYTALWGVMATAIHPSLTAVAIAAGLADVVENIAILRAIRRKDRTDDDARRIRVPSSIKWALLAMLWIALAFVPASLVANLAGRVVIRVSYLVAAAACLTGLAVSRPDLVGRSVRPVFVALLTQLIALYAARPRSAPMRAAS